MNKWIIGARVKTLPAAISPVLVGTALATEVNWVNALLALIVSLALQISVNYANDYSDGVRGTDSNRVGPIRLVGSGLAATVGSYYIQTQKISGQSVLLSIPVGALACAILVMNNLRDLPMDAQVGKRTFSVRIGDKNTRYFYVALLVLAQVISAYAYTFNSYALLTLIWLPLTVKNCRLVLQGVTGKELIPLLISTARLQLLD